MKYSHYVGLDVHANSISVAVVARDDEGVLSLGNCGADIGSVRKCLKKIGDLKKMCVCYEAGPSGYALYWELTALGVECIVVAPALIPQRVGDRVKTDRKDAQKLARLLRAGELTKVWVPDREHEAVRNLVRARAACVRDRRRAQQRIEKLLLREGLRAPLCSSGKAKGKKRVKGFGRAYMEWLNTISFEHFGTQRTFDDYKAEVVHQNTRMERLERELREAIVQAPESLRQMVMCLQALKGVAETTAIAVAVEVGDFSRFAKAPQLMAWAGLVPQEYSSGGPGKSKRFGITKTGNAHLRRVLAESAWMYRHKPKVARAIARRRERTSAAVIAIAEKAEQRLHERYLRMLRTEKPKNKVMTAIARELLGFIWAIGQQVGREVALAATPTTRKYQLRPVA
jgi:transposase